MGKTPSPRITSASWRWPSTSSRASTVVRVSRSSWVGITPSCCPVSARRNAVSPSALIIPQPASLTGPSAHSVRGPAARPLIRYCGESTPSPHHRVGPRTRRRSFPLSTPAGRRCSPPLPLMHDMHAGGRASGEDRENPVGPDRRRPSDHRARRPTPRRRQPSRFGSSTISAPHRP